MHDDEAPQPGAGQPAEDAEHPLAAADPAPSSGEPPHAAAEPPLDPAELAAIQAAKAAKKALKAQKQADKARRLAAEYARLAAGESPEAEPAEAAAADPVLVAADPADRSRNRGALITASIVCVASLVFAVIALIVHLTGGPQSSAGAAAVRDDVLLSARQDIVVLNTLDYRSVDAGLRRWSDASTGALHDSLARVSATEKKDITQAKAVTTAKVLDAAVVNLDPRAGSASVIASVELTVRPSGQHGVVKRERLSADLARVGDSWKVSSIGQVGVTLG